MDIPETSFRSLLENVNLITVFLDTEGIVTYFSPFLLSLTGYSSDELMGKDWFQFIKPGGNQDTRVEFLKNIKNGNIIQSFENQIILRNGELRNIRWNNVLLHDSSGSVSGISSIGEDITDFRKSEDELKERELQYRNLSNAGVALIWTSGKDALCNYFNDSWLNFTGRSFEQELGNGWAEGVHPDDLQRCIDIYTSAFGKKEPFDMEYRIKHHSGEYR